METLEKSRMCRLCGKDSRIVIDIFDQKENHLRKINTVLPILVHKMDLLPKQMCYRCSYKLGEFYQFYVKTAKVDTELKSQLSWMRKENLEDKIATPMVKVNMVKVNRFKIKTEPPGQHSNSVVEQISENPLVIPDSCLQTYNLHVTPMLASSCNCNRKISTNKQCPDNLSDISNQEIDNQLCLNPCRFSNSTDTSSSANKTPLLEHANVVGTMATKVNGVQILKTETLNRALRPRKDLVDYMGRNRKNLSTNLKVKLKSKLDILGPLLVNPGPIIKLEKVDNAIEMLKVSKNFKKFTRTMKDCPEKINQKALNESRNSRYCYNNDLQQKHLHKTESQNAMFSDRTHLSLHSNNANLDMNVKKNAKMKNVLSLVKLQMKQNSSIEDNSNDKVHESMSQQKNSHQLANPKQGRTEKSEDKLTYNAFVKLEKDHRYNLNYPTIKIKRYLPLHSSMIEDRLLDDSIKQNKVCSAMINKKSFIHNYGNDSTKHLRSKNKILQNFKVKNKRRREILK